MRIYLTREVDYHKRYYIIDCFVNLFSQLTIERIYGRVGAKNPTRIYKQHFISKEEAIKAFKELLSKKQKRGYEIVQSNILSFNTTKEKKQ